MTKNMNVVRSSRVKSKGDQSAKAVNGRDGVHRMNDIAAEQADGAARSATNATVEPFDRVRVDASDRPFVHARDSGAHGDFEACDAHSPALSLMALPSERDNRTCQIAVLVEDGVHHASLVSLNTALADAGAVVHFVGPRVGMFIGDSAEGIIEADKSMENSPGALFDALVVPDGSEAIRALASNGHTMEFIKDMFRHNKTILALDAGRELLEMAGLGPAMDEDYDILLADGADAAGIAAAFIDAAATHRHLSHDSDPPLI